MRVTTAGGGTPSPTSGTGNWVRATDATLTRPTLVGPVTASGALAWATTGRPITIDINNTTGNIGFGAVASSTANVLVQGVDPFLRVYNSSSGVFGFHLFKAGVGEWSHGFSTSNDYVFSPAALLASPLFTMRANGQFVVGNGTAALPAIVRAGGTSGIYFTATPTMGFSIAGVSKFVLSTTQALFAGSIGVGNHAAATTLGAVTGKIEVFSTAGASLGFWPVYGSIT